MRFQCKACDGEGNIQVHGEDGLVPCKVCKGTCLSPRYVAAEKLAEKLAAEKLAAK
jgi:excinuclease UvrABC ATPase subunit